jgi:AraC-like DNA-binding protein
MKFKIVPPPEHLKEHVECIRIGEYTGEWGLAINVHLSGLPGIVFQHRDGGSPIENIMTPSSLVDRAPTLYVYGQMTQPSVMNHKKGPFTTTQVILKPHALQTLLGINASVMTNALVELTDFSAYHLNMQLLDAHNEQERLTLITSYLWTQLEKANTRDRLIEESLCLIDKYIGSITVKFLLDTLNISERHFERRFNQAVGVSPQFYIRVKRFNEAMRLMKTRRFEKLTDVAYALNFYDQSHFIRDIKAFSGVTPKSLSQKVDDFHHDPGGYFQI